MPRDSHKSMSGSDDRVRGGAHIVILIAGVILLFVGGGAGLVYSSLANRSDPPQNTPTIQVQTTASASAHASPTTHTSPTAQTPPIRVAADATDLPAEVAFTNAKVWML